MYGGASGDLLDENSIFDPKSPYAAAKVYAHNLTKIYRESYGLFCVNGDFYLTMSHQDVERLVTRKITRAVTRISTSLQEKINIG